MNTKLLQVTLAFINSGNCHKNMGRYAALSKYIHREVNNALILWPSPPVITQSSKVIYGIFC